MMQRTVLCYGDSNTWGYVPLADYSKGIQRYSRNERWPGRLQKLLGDNYYVVEEGLNSRTTNITFNIPPDRNGKTYLPPCLYTHSPIDLVVLALGGNDLKAYFKREPEDIRDGLAELIDIIQSSKYGEQMQSPPKILIMTQPIPLPMAEKCVDENGIFYLQNSVKKAEALIKLYSDLSKDKKCYFLDISKSIILSKIDGVHLDAEAHKKIAQLVFKKINDIF